MKAEGVELLSSRPGGGGSVPRDDASSESDWNRATVIPDSLLVVEEDHATGDMLVRRLGLEGYSVTLAVSGDEAIKLASTRCFDLVLLSIRIPDLDGITFLRELKGTDSTAGLPVIIVTTMAASGDAIDAIVQHASDYIIKPLDMVSLLARIRAQIARKRAIEALYASESRFRALTELMPHLVWSCLPNGRCDYLNRRWLQYTGASEDELLGDGWMSALHPDDRERVKGCWKAAIANRGEYDVAYRLRASGGDYRWFQARGAAQRDGEGSIVRWFGTCTDIDEQRRTERDLVEAAERLGSIVDNVADGIFTIDQAGIIQSVNLAGERLFGYDASEIVGQNVSVLMPQPERSAHDDYIARYIRTKEARILAGEARQVGVGRELNGLRRDGSEFPIELTVGKFRSGDRHYFTGVIRDITDRKKAEQSMRTFANRLVNLLSIDHAILSAGSAQAVAEAALSRLVHLDLCWAGSVTLIDKELRTLEVLAVFGLADPAFPVGTSLSLDILDPAYIDALLRGGAVEIPDICTARVSDEIRDRLHEMGLRSCIMMPLIERGVILGSLNLGWDIPSGYAPENLAIARELADHLALALRQALLNEEVQSAQSRLEALSRELLRAQEDERRRIARELHDEIGQSLTALKINLQELGAVRDSSPRLQESIDIVDLTLQQVRGMALDLRPPFLDDLGLVPALEWFVASQSQRTKVHGRFVSDPEEITVDPRIKIACYRLVQEALNNVAKHACAAQFSVELLQHARGLQLVVRDNGVGFELHRVNVETSFGLSGMKERVDQLGGKIEIVSEPGAGTEIHIDLPNVPL